MASNSDVPTDPDEYALYMQYGPNWRAASGRLNKRDRGGRYDRFMKFFHTTPFQPMPIETLKFENPYEKPDVITEPDWYYQLNETQRQIFDLLSNYFPANTLEPEDFEERDLLNGVMDWSNPNTTAPNSAWDRNVIAPPYDPINDPTPPTGDPMAYLDPEVASRDPLKYYFEPDSLRNSSTGTSATQPYRIAPRAEQTTAAYTQMAKNNAASAAAAPASNDRGGDRIVAAAPAPAPAPAPVVSRANPPAAAKTTMSDKYITRYDRDEFSPVVAPVKTVVKKSVTPVKVWGNRNN